MPKSVKISARQRTGNQDGAQSFKLLPDIRGASTKSLKNRGNTKHKNKGTRSYPPQTSPAHSAASGVVSVHEAAEHRPSRKRQHQSADLQDKDSPYKKQRLSTDENEGESSSFEQKKRKKASVSLLTVSGKAASRWTPISSSAVNMLMNTMEAAVIPSLGGLKGGTRRKTEATLLQVMSRVKERLSSRTAPSTRRVENYFTVRAQLSKVVKECVSVVERNEEVSVRLEERISQLEALEQRVKNKKEELASLSDEEEEDPEGKPVMDNSFPSLDCEKEEFIDKMVQFLQKDKNDSLHPTIS